MLYIYIRMLGFFFLWHVSTLMGVCRDMKSHVFKNIKMTERLSEGENVFHCYQAASQGL